MTNIETMKLALEALENNKRTHHYCEDTWYSCPKHEDGCANDVEGDECNCGADKANAEIDTVMEALRQAIEQAQQAVDWEKLYRLELKKKEAIAAKYEEDIKPLTKIVPMAQQAQPCGLECDCTDVCKQDNYKALWEQMCERCDALDKQLAERTWIGLTDEEVFDVWLNEMPAPDKVFYQKLCRSVEAKLKEKNT